MRRSDLLLEARRLRSEDVGVRAISRRLGVPQSTVSTWTRGVLPASRPPGAIPLHGHRLVVWQSGATRRCARCRVATPLELFGRTAAGRQGWCRACFRAHAKERGDAHRTQVRRSVLRRRATARAWIVEYLADHPCKDCSSTDVAVLEFDHIGDKTGNVGALVAEGRALHRIVEEVAKCEVVCPNCHRRRTAQRGGWLRASPTWRLELGSRTTTKARNQLVALEHLASSGCVDCGEEDITVLDFDHVGPKRLSVMTLAASGASIQTLLDEIGQCEVRCATCHRRATAERGGHYRANLRALPPASDDDPQLRRERARRLRREGGTIAEIAAAVAADPKTVGRWVHDLKLSEEEETAARGRRRAERMAADAGPDADEMRVCSACNVEKPSRAFSLNGPRRHSQCKACFAARYAARSDEDRAAAAARQRERRRRAKEQRQLRTDLP